MKWSTYIKTTSGNVSADQGTLLGITKLEEGVGSLLLLLLAMEIKDRKVDIVKELGVVLHTSTATEEDNDLLLEVALEEREEEKEPLVGLADNITLLETLHGTVLLLLINVDVQGTGSQRDTSKILDLGRLSGREEHGLSVLLGEDLDDLSHFILETNLENSISLINDERLKILEDERSVLEVIEEATRSSDKQVNTLGKLVGLSATVCASNNDAVGLRVVGHELTGNTKDLKGQFASGRDDNDASTVARLEAQSTQHLDNRN